MENKMTTIDDDEETPIPVGVLDRLIKCQILKIEDGYVWPTQRLFDEMSIWMPKSIR